MLPQWQLKQLLHGNYPIADKLTYQTADPDIYVGGDVFTGPKFVIDAIAQGHYVADSLARHAAHLFNIFLERIRFRI